MGGKRAPSKARSGPRLTGWSEQVLEELCEADSLSLPLFRGPDMRIRCYLT